MMNPTRSVCYEAVSDKCWKATYEQSIRSGYGASRKEALKHLAEQIWYDYVKEEILFGDVGPLMPPDLHAAVLRAGRVYIAEEARILTQARHRLYLLRESKS